MRRLRVYVANWMDVDSQYYICNVLTCRDVGRGALIEPHFFYEYYSKAGRHVNKEGLRVEYYDMTKDCVLTTRGVMCTIAPGGRLALERCNDVRYPIAPLYDF